MELKDMMSQAMKMAETAKQMQASVHGDGSAGGGMVTVRVRGDHRVESLKIDPAILDPPDVDLLEDLIVAAVNQAQTRVNEALQAAAMSQMSGLSSMLGVDPSGESDP